ncbi:MAG: hypothetical protein JXQ87_04085 [Bacteroidia bacterium]
MINPNKRIWQAGEIWKTFNFSLPFSAFLKNYFKRNKKYGKRDRNEISHVLYSYLRIGYNNQVYSFEKAAQLGLLLSSHTPLPLLEAYKTPSNWNELNPYEKINWCKNHIEFNFSDNFFKETLKLSQGVVQEKFAQKVLKQSPVFIRVLKDYQKLINYLKEAELNFEEIDEHSIKLQADAKIHLLPQEISKSYYIQDLASQQTANYLDPKNGELWWDACCGAGGKSLLLNSINQRIHLTGTDVRDSILVNYKKRLSEHGIGYNAFRANLLNKGLETRDTFDGIVIDAPCSGSGTWGRSPDGILKTRKADIDGFAKRQKQICLNAIKNLKKGGKLTYITCSIFRAENEDITQFLIDELNIELVKQGIIHSSIHNSDYLFAAQFIYNK